MLNVSMLNIQTILVPQGAEHRAVCRGLGNVLHPPAVFPVPVGAIALTAHLEQLQQSGCFWQGQQVLIMGLCGGLSPTVGVGAGVLYDACTMAPPDGATAWLPCDHTLNAAIRCVLGEAIQSVQAVTSDRVVARASEKADLAQQSGAIVVDMEGYAALQVLLGWGVAVATLRVVSDDCQHDIPNLAAAFDDRGALQPMALAIAMLKQPIAALRLIRGSTESLKILQNLTSELFEN
ncbi:MAG: phosphorylase [Leptolyngbyaceae cyanobacterium bins.349]|nr:phosphorylase [Leptolyngbyaceae cyanobacterium bins.349]